MNLLAASCEVSEVEIEEFELNIMSLFPLVLDIDTDHVAIAAFPYGRHEESVCPQLTAPKFLPQCRMPTKQLSCRDALYYLYHPRWRKLWGCAHQVMDVIRVYPYLLKLYAVPFFDFLTYRLEALFPVRNPKYCLAIFYRRYEMIMNLIRIVIRFPDRSHILQSYTRIYRAASCAELSS